MGASSSAGAAHLAAAAPHRRTTPFIERWTKTFPELEGVDIEFNWSGLVGMTLDQLPHVGRIDKRTCVCLGFNGSGIAMASLLGQQAAAFVAGEAPDISILDARDLKTVPFYPLRAPGIRMVAGWYQFLDAIGR